MSETCSYILSGCQTVVGAVIYHQPCPVNKADIKYFRWFIFRTKNDSNSVQDTSS